MYVLARQEPFYTPSLMISRSLLEEIGGFDASLVIREDTDVIFRLCFKTRFCFISERLVKIDRSPSRDIGLCNLYSKRDNRTYDSLERLYTKWLAMPEVVGTEYERPIRALLQDVCYGSAECKIHQLRIGSALRAIGRLRAMGVSYPGVFVTLLSRKIRKLCRDLGSPERTGEPKPVGPGLNLA